MQYIIYDLFHHATVQTRLAGRDHKMGPDRARHAFHVIGYDIITAMNGRVGLAGAVEGERAAWAYAQFDAAMIARRPHQLNDIIFHARFYMHFTNHLL